MYAALFAATLAACLPVVWLLPRARWTWHAPRVAILSWQAVGLGLGLALIGLPLSVGLAPYGAPTVGAVARFGWDLLHGDLPAGMAAWRVALTAAGLLVAGRLLWVTVACLVRALRAQRRHRELLTLVGRVDPAAPGALVLDHPSAAAYCLPGLRPAVVVSAGALRLLGRAELAAVLDHERAHAAERHDLVLLPFTALCQALPARWLRAARDAVALLVEMCADDRARRRHADAPLVAALRRFATLPGTGVPAGALGLADRDLEVRMRRLAERRRPPVVRAAVTLAISSALAGLPAGLFLLPG
jgi:Zn-dependent protease with chaperone function